jgi:hypothetical protein
MKNLAEQIALDWMNGDEPAVYNALTRYSNTFKTSALAILVYKELEKASEQVSATNDDAAFLLWLQNS